MRAVEPISTLRSRPDDSDLTPEEVTAYRSLLGVLLYAATWTRGDLACAVSLAAQRTSTAKIVDAKSLNKVAKAAVEGCDRQIVIRRGILDLPSSKLVVWGDSAFANAEGEKSQYGICLGLTHDPDKAVNQTDFTGVIPIMYRSATVKRVVRSTLAAEAYAISEAIETAQLIRHVLLEITFSPDRSGAGSTRSGTQPRVATLKKIEQDLLSYPICCMTDSDNLSQSLRKDAGQIQDKRLRIVIAMLRQTLELEPHVRVKWIPTHMMVADPLTKLGLPLDLLDAFMASRKVSVTPNKKYANWSPNNPTASEAFEAWGMTQHNVDVFVTHAAGLTRGG